MGDGKDQITVGAGDENRSSRSERGSKDRSASRVRLRRGLTTGQAAAVGLLSPCPAGKGGGQQRWATSDADRIGREVGREC